MRENIKKRRGTKMRNVRIDNEAGAQEALFSWIAYQLGKYPELELAYHIPNGGKRNAREAANLKRQGVKAGVPDIHLPVARGRYHGLYIELKVGRNTQTEKQKEWQRKLTEQGYLSIVCYGWQDAAEHMVSYLEMNARKHGLKAAATFMDEGALMPAT